MMENVQGKPGPIIPPEAAPLRNLTVTMTVMCYLASLAIGALILIEQSVADWTHGLSKEATVQLRVLDKVDIEFELKKAIAILEATDGVESAQILDQEAGLKLLEPWLGETDLADLPVPRLIRVAVSNAKPPDYEILSRKLSADVRGASLDTHRRWQVEMARMGHTLSLLSFLILGLICSSSFAMVVFAARAVLAANREVVDVLHLVGAKDSYIAHQIDRRFMATGLFAGLSGVSLAVLTFLGLGYSGNLADNSVAMASHNLLFGTNSFWTYLALLSVPCAATAIAVFSAKMTLMNMLKASP